VSRNLIKSNFFRHRPNTGSNVGAESNQHYSYQSATSQLMVYNNRSII